MEFATGALGTLIPKLAQLLQDEYNLQKGAKKDIEFLSRELESMRVALRNVGEVPREQLSELVRIWARDVRELSYDMEDIVDTFLVRVQGPEPPSKKSTRRFIKKIIQKVTKASTRRGLTQEVKDVKERVKEVAERRDRYKVDTISPAKTLVDPRVTALYTKLTDLVGIDKAREELILRLTQDDMPTQQQKIISIVGIGGLGKTTLAKAVCAELKMQFDCTAFVPVSRNPDTMKLLKDILYELDKKRYKKIHYTMLDERQLIDKVRKFLKNKRYLIVMDDIWSMDPWNNIIRCALVENNMRSRIITTTRIIGLGEEVADYCYKLKPLTPNNSKILFCRRIFGCMDKLPEHYSDVSEKILNKCGGIPLAIITTSSLLANKLGNVEEWYKLCDSIGYGIGSNHDMENMRKILSLSYYDLPSHLKTCLLYLSIFPEDYEIGRKRLIWRWIAEDFIQDGEGGQSLFEIGDSYFNELVNRSLIQPTYLYDFQLGWSYSGDHQSCRVHNMVHDLICSISREENFVTTGLGDSNQNTLPAGRKIHRLTLHHSNWTPWNISMLNMSKLRSLILSGPAVINSMSSSSLGCFYLLRVLDLKDCILGGRPSLRFIGNLLHLRYLDLPYEVYTDELLVEIGKLQYLQTLDLGGAHHIQELPSSILGLSRLMLLSVQNYARLPAGLSNLTSLEELRGVSVDSTQMAEDLGCLTQLRVLDIWVRKDKEGRGHESLHTALVDSLGKLHKIKSLTILNNSLVADLEGLVDSIGYLRHLTIHGISLQPTWINPASVPLLSRLDLLVSQVGRQDIQVLGMLPALTSLRLVVKVQDTNMLERFTVAADAFPCLVTCMLYGFSVLPSMFPQGAMLRLQRLAFNIYLEAFTEGEFTVDDLALGHLPSLQNVEVVINGHGIGRVIQELTTEVKMKIRREGDVHPNRPSVHI